MNILLLFLMYLRVEPAVDWTVNNDFALREQIYTSLYDPKLENWANENLQVGDLIFRKGDEHVFGFNFSQYICDITNSNYSHVGMIWRFDDKTYIFELGPAGTTRKPLSLFLQESVDRRVLIKRIKPDYSDRIPKALTYVWIQYMRNTQFDYSFRLGNNKLYCAEMIVESFRSDRLLLAAPAKVGNLPGIDQHIVKTFIVIAGSYFMSEKPFSLQMKVYSVRDIIQSKYLTKVYEGQL